MSQGHNARRKVTWNLINLESKEILDLSAGNDDGNAVRETHDYRARDELDRRAQTRRSQYQQQNASHHGAHEQPIDAVSRNNSKYDDHEGASGTTDLR